MPEQGEEDEREAEEGKAAYDGPERRTEGADRRAKPRGGRRATDAIYKVAGFVYKLLTEPPPN